MEEISVGKLSIPLLLMGLLSCFVFTLLWRRDFFVLKRKARGGGHLSTVLGSVLAYFVPPVIFAVIYKLFSSGESIEQWALFLGTLLGGISVLIYSFFCGKQIWGKNPCFPSFLQGVLSWFYIFPFVFFSSLLGTFILALLGYENLPSQVAMSMVKAAKSDTLLLSLQLFLVIVVAPLSEEVLFRGFLQRFLVKHWGRVWGIVVVSLVFALFHFSSSQGVGNFPLILALFVLSLFLGWMREKKSSLWTPIGLHVTFNAVSITLALMI